MPVVRYNKNGIKTFQYSVMKKPFTFRLDAELMEKARDEADKENRTLTNWIETLIKQRLSEKKDKKGV